MNADQVKEHFAKQADEYEQLMVRLVPQYLEQHAVIAALLPEGTRACRVLDLGCGNGTLSEIVFRRLPQASVVGFDLTQDMLKAYAEKHAGYAGRFELRQGDFRADPLGGGYDIILAGLTLHHLTWEERERFYQTLHAALNPSGLIIFRDIIIDEDPAVTADHYCHWQAHMRAHGEDADFWFAKHREKDHPMTLTDHFAWLGKAGFARIACHWRLWNFAVTSAVRRR